MTDLTIRHAASGDYAAVAALNTEVQQIHAEAQPWMFKPASADTFPREAYESLLAQGKIIWIAERDGRALGYIMVERMERPEDAARYALSLLYIHHIAVTAAARGTGIGDALLRTAFAYAREQGIKSVHLDTGAFNTAAQAFFRKYGFEPINIRHKVEL